MVEQRYQAVLAVIWDGQAVVDVAARWRVSRQTVHGGGARVVCITVGAMEEPGRGPAYQPLTLARLSALLADSDESRRWRLVAEFLEEYGWEPPDSRYGMLVAQPARMSPHPGGTSVRAK